MADQLEVPATCPTCESGTRELHYLLDGTRTRASFRGPRTSLDDGENWCRDAWHDVPSPDKRRLHFPKIARTLYDGPGNAGSIHGCSCGAAIANTEAFADHAGLPTYVVQSMLDLAGLAEDLVAYPGALEIEDVTQVIRRCLEFRW